MKRKKGKVEDQRGASFCSKQNETFHILLTKRLWRAETQVEIQHFYKQTFSV